jgi:hypothetical protein
MKTKVTLTIDRELLPQAKIYARTHGHSLSELIENSLREMSHAEDQPFSKRWKGRFKKSHQHGSRYKLLAKRYF